jgi:hypothetical protein
MNSRWAWFGLILASCVVRLNVDEKTKIACADDQDCPSPMVCEPSLNECVLPGFVPRERIAVTLAFSTPRAGETDVSLSPQIIVVFDRGVDAESFRTRRTLRVAGGDAVALVDEETSLANTYVFSPQTPLLGETTYELVIAAGVTPIEETFDANADIVLSFRTAAAPDRTPPQPPTDVVVDVGPVFRTLRFSNPNDADFAGVLIVRTLGGEAVAVPEDGVIYSGGDDLGNSQVVGSTSEGSFADLIGADADVDYLLFPFDENANYGAAVHPPRVRDAVFRWCPNELLYARAGSPDGGEMATQVNAQPAAEASPALVFGPLDALSSVASELAPSGSTRYVRAVVRTASGVVRGLERTLSLPSATVVLTPNVTSLGVGGRVRVGLSAPGWSAVEVEVDTDPSPSTEGGFAPVAVSGAISGSGAFAEHDFNTPAGGYVLRARPLAQDCLNDGRYSYSSLLSVGNALYVAPSGSDSASGSDPQHAFATIAHAISAAAPGTDIRIAAGRYDEALLIDGKGLSLSGSYDSTFATQNVDVHPSRVVWHGGSEPTDTDPTFAVTNAEVHASHIVFDYDSVGAVMSRDTVLAGVGSSLYLERCAVFAPVTTPEVHAVAGIDTVFLQVRDSTIGLGAGSGSLTHFWGLDFAGEQLSVTGNRFIGAGRTCNEHRGVFVRRGIATIEGNSFSLDAGTTRVGVVCGDGSSTDRSCAVIGNDMSFGTGGSAVGVSYSDVINQPAFRSKIVANRIFGLTSGTEARGIFATNARAAAGTLEISNNVVHTGNANTAFGLELMGSVIALVTHNIFIAGGLNGSVSAAVMLSGFSLPSFENNILATSGNNSTRYCVFEGAADTDPASFVSNLMFACPSALYFNENGLAITDIASVNTLDNSQLAWPAGCTVACETARYNLNRAAALGTTLSTFFTDFDGTDNNPATWDDNNYFFATPDPLLTAGGNDPLLLECGTHEAPMACVLPQTVECGSRGCDYFGAPRVCTGVSTCVSFGPFEQH